MRILIIRHADPEYDGDTLTAAGHAEAEALARRLCRPQQEGAGRLSKLFSSPMGRARTTAAYTEKLSGLQAETLHWTRELTYWPRLGIEQRPGEGGMALWDVSGEIVRTAHGLTVENQFDLVPTIAKAREPFLELASRSDDFIESLGYKRESDGTYSILKRNRDTVAVFCHGGFGLTWMAWLLGIPVAQAWSSFYLAPSSVTTILMDERSTDRAVPRALAVSDVGHLYAEGLTISNSKYEKPNRFTSEPRPSGIKANFF